MLKEKLVSNILKLLEDSGYRTARYKGCFDIIAKKNNILLIKVLYNIESVQKEQAKNLKIISSNLDAHALLVGKQTSREKLKDSIVYERFELPVLNLETLKGLISRKIFPEMYRDKGGLYVEIDSELLRSLRKKKHLTQRELAEIIGVNKKVIYEHEKKHLRMMLSIAQKLENILDKKITKPAKVFKDYSEHGKPDNYMEKIVNAKLREKGFKTDFVNQAPFDVFAKEKMMLLSEIESDKKKLIKKVDDFKNFIKVIKKPGILISRKIKEKDIEGIPVIDFKDLDEVTTKELIKIAKNK